MKIYLRSLIALLLLTLISATPSLAAQEPPEWHDDLVAHLSGSWNITGQVMGRDAHHQVSADWTLNHQFLRLHEVTSASAPAAESKYEAIWFLGYDPTSERYVLHLLDVFGGRFSETLGYGTRAANQINFVFEYPDGPFHTTFRYSPDTDSWEWLMEQKNKEGRWASFADLKLTRASQ